MKAMILAAGRGERMRPLTDNLPKPLLSAGNQPLIVWHINRLVAAGITNIIINHAWLGYKIEQYLGNGNKLGASITYSAEQTALETAGGINKALPFFAGKPFLVINGDIWCDWDPAESAMHIQNLNQANALAWLLMVNNPAHNISGDFIFPELTTKPLTFSGIGIYSPKLFSNIESGQAAPMAPLLHQAIQKQRVIASAHKGEWMDIGTPQRLQLLNQKLKHTRTL